MKYPLDVTLFSQLTKIMEKRHGKKCVDSSLEEIVELWGKADKLYSELPNRSE